jgi:hypothetical protein
LRFAAVTIQEQKHQAAFVLQREGGDNQVPLLRYFLSVGAALVALLFVVNWVSPGSAPVQQASTQTPANDTSLRIQSGQKWPEKIVFDTTMPTIVPPPPPVIAATAPVGGSVTSPLEARAEMKPVVQPVLPPKRQARVHRRVPQRAPAPTWVAANPPGWSWNW